MMFNELLSPEDKNLQAFGELLLDTTIAFQCEDDEALKILFENTRDTEFPVDIFQMETFLELYGVLYTPHGKSLLEELKMIYLV